MRGAGEEPGAILIAPRDAEVLSIVPGLVDRDRSDERRAKRLSDGTGERRRVHATDLIGSKG